MYRVPAYLCDSDAENLVRECDEDFEKRLTALAEDIAEASDGIRAIAMSGPSCSGKTTAAKRLSEVLVAYGKKVHTISIDDYYLDRDVLFEKNPDGKLDFDSPETIDLVCLAMTVNQIYADNIKTVEIPVFDFLTGKQTKKRTIDIDERDVFIFEGIQALYPQVTSLFAGYPTASVFICPDQCIDADGIIFTQNRIRLMRRLVRDYYRRGATASYSFGLWESVRENEEKNIFPYAKKAMYSICSTMKYELAMLKPHLEKILPAVSPDDRAYDEAMDILHDISTLTVIPEKYLAKNSLFHEFL